MLDNFREIYNRELGRIESAFESDILNLREVRSGRRYRLLPGRRAF